MTTLPSPTDAYWLEAPIADICRPRGVRESGRMMNGLDVANMQTSATKAAMKRGRTTPAIKDRIVQMARADTIYREIAAATGVSETQVADIVRAAGAGRGQGRHAATGKKCIAPDCGKPLHPANKRGLCMDHQHAPGLCGCPKCRKVRHG